MVRRGSRSAERGQEAHLKAWEAFPLMWEWSLGPPGGPVWVGRPTRRSRRGREAHPEDRAGREAHPKVR